jgi:AcrR family transcriptional regulator
MPRRYALGKRADEMAATRARIVDATMELYRERGFAAATVPAIARAADVAPATVRNHFPDMSQLASAVAERILKELRVPGPEIFDGLDSIGDRITRLATEVAEFMARSEHWWPIYTGDPGLSEAWAGEEASYERRQEALVRAALGPLADDEAAVAIASVVVGPQMYYALRGHGLSTEEAIDAATSLAVPWLEARLAARTASRSHAERPASTRRGP